MTVFLMSAVVFTLLTLVKSRLKISFRQFLFAVIMQHIHKASVLAVKQACSVALTQQVCNGSKVWYSFNTLKESSM